MAKGIYVGASPNLVVNGDFSNGTNNWNITSYANATVKNDETLGDYLHIDWLDTVTSGVVVYNSEMDFENGDIIYMSFIAKAYSSNTSITHCFVNTLIPDISNDDTWHNISVIGTADGTRGTLLSIYQSKPSAIGNKLDITNIKFFNLTNMFGAGNEPTKEWCDANLDILESRGVAHKVTKAYVGVDNKARKVKKGYIGVNGVARLFYSAETLVPFTSNPAPTTWTDSSDYLSATATNDYGEWRVNATYLQSSAYRVSKAVDAENLGTSYKTSLIDSDSKYAPLTLTLPTGVSIKPTSITVKHQFVGDRCKVQGSTGTTWVDLATLTKASSNIRETFDITGDTYYSAFRLKLYRYSAAYEIIIDDFKITAGTIKIEE